MVRRSPATELPAAATAAPSVFWLKLQTVRQIDATSAATPEASFTTKVCMEKITLSSLL